MTTGDKNMGTRGLSWGHEESLLLIELWSDETVQRDLELAPKSNRHLFEKIRREIQNRVPEFDRTPEECRGRIKRLKRKYYETRKSGGYQLACPYYEQLDAVLGSKPIPHGVFMDKSFLMRQPHTMGQAPHPEHASSMDNSRDNSFSASGYDGMDFSASGGLNDTVNGGSTTAGIGGTARGPVSGSKESELNFN